ncbi:MAG: Fur family zinc uptake transcriptional regulator [Parasphingorhabdus sp.]|jgi:Fur family zinc uptake transcriptional regulator
MSTQASSFPQPHHDHAQCVEKALREALSMCDSRGTKLTVNRQRVFELIWTSHCPVTAYELLEQLQALGLRVQAPMVYRCLEFLLEQGLIHRVESLNAFVGCSNPSTPHAAELLICEKCGVAAEATNAKIDQNLEQTAKNLNFTIQNCVIELSGLCGFCSPSPDK